MPPNDFRIILGPGKGPKALRTLFLFLFCFSFLSLLSDFKKFLKASSMRNQWSLNFTLTFVAILFIRLPSRILKLSPN